jgi:hypothetical protein
MLAKPLDGMAKASKAQVHFINININIISNNSSNEE